MSVEMHEVAAGEAGYPVLPSVGAQLVAGREAKALTVADVAQTLKLGVRQVEALENGDWGGLPGATFIRGFVRNYARLVQVDAGPLMEQLDAVLEPPRPRLDLPETAPATMPTPGAGQGRDYAMAMFGLVLVVVALAIYFLMPADLTELRKGLQSLVASDAKKEAAAVQPAVPEPVLPPGATAQQVLNPQAVAPGESSPAGLAPPPLLQDAAPPVPAAGPAVPAAAAEGTPALRFVVEKESWIEVKGGDGKVLYSQKTPAGSEPAVSGKGPYALVVGNAPGVRVILRGQPVDLAPHARGDVARLVLD